VIVFLVEKGSGNWDCTVYNGEVFRLEVFCNKFGYEFGCMRCMLRGLLFSLFKASGVTFKTTVFPAAIAPREGQRQHHRGKFHGPIINITPSGSFLIRHLLNLNVGTTGTYSSVAQASTYHKSGPEVSWTANAYISDNAKGILNECTYFHCNGFLLMLSKVQSQ